MNQPDTRATARRYLPLAGAAYTALMVLGAALFPAPPGGDVSAASQPAWLASHHDAMIAQSYVRALGALAFIVLSVAVANALRRALPAGSPLPGLALVGGVICGCLVLLAQAASLAAALFVHAGGGVDTTRALGALQNGFLDMSAVPAVLLFGATGVASLHSGVLPRWLAVVSLAGVPFALADAASYDGGPLGSIGLLGLVYFLAWGLLTGVRLHLGHRAHDTARPASALAA